MQLNVSNNVWIVWQTDYMVEQRPFYYCLTSGPLFLPWALFFAFWLVSFAKVWNNVGKLFIFYGYLVSCGNQFSEIFKYIKKD